MSRFRVKRTPNTGPPAGLLFGELAYSDGDQQLYVGRDTEEEPTTFRAGLGDVAGQLAALETSQGTQDESIALLNASSNSQADAISLLATTTSTQGDAIAALATDVEELQAAPPPVTGWDYIGAIEPVAPAVGFTWWEKVDGVTVGRWDWTGSLWVALAVNSVQAQNGNAFSLLNTGWGLTGLIYIRKFWLRAAHSMPRDATNYYSIQVATVSRGAAVMDSRIVATTENLDAALTLITAPKVALTHPPGFSTDRGHLRVFAVAQGSPGGWQGQTAWLLQFSEVRS
jgi:hypothetical protein